MAVKPPPILVGILVGIGMFTLTHGHMSDNQNPGVNSCGRLLHSVHGSGWTILTPGFDCDAYFVGYFTGESMMPRNLRWCEMVFATIHSMCRVCIA